MDKVHNTARDCGDFNLRLNEDGTWPDQRVQIALLADIRRELRTLNRPLSCPNFVAIPTILRNIRRNTAKPKRRKGKKP